MANTKGRYTTGEVTGLAAAALAIAAIGVGMNLADHGPHIGDPPAGIARDQALAPPSDLAAATAGADFARPLTLLSSASPSPLPDGARLVAVPPAPLPSPESSTAPLVIRHVLPIAGAIRYGEWHWDETGAPATGLRVITIDLEARVISVFRDGYEIGTAAVLLGTQEKPTPTGVFPISEKDAHHKSNLYDAPMPYMLRLTNDGVTIHATNVQNGYASHGCIGVPTGFARKLFAEVRLGDRVYITRGKHVGLGDDLTN